MLEDLPSAHKGCATLTSQPIPHLFPRSFMTEQVEKRCSGVLQLHVCAYSWLMHQGKGCQLLFKYTANNPLTDTGTNCPHPPPARHGNRYTLRHNFEGLCEKNMLNCIPLLCVIFQLTRSCNATHSAFVFIRFIKERRLEARTSS